MTSKTSIRQIKIEAKQLNKDQGIQHSQALELVSQRHGFQNWHQARKLTEDNNNELNQLETKHQIPFRFIMDRKDSNWDFSDNTNSNYLEDDDLFESILTIGIKSGLTEQRVVEFLEDLIFLKHKTASPETPFEAIEIITNDFFFPPICIWLNGVEHISSIDPSNLDKSHWNGYSHNFLFDEYVYDA